MANWQRRGRSVLAINKIYIKHTTTRREVVLSDEVKHLYHVIAANCVCALRSLLAQHQTRERVRPEDILSHIKKHRLFPQTEASIRLRFHDVKNCFNLGLEV